jgi:hypothetical protein
LILFLARRQTALTFYSFIDNYHIDLDTVGRYIHQILDGKDRWSLKSLFAAPASGEAVAKITASHIRAGMTLSRPVHTLRGVVLLPSGIELSETDKQKLIVLNVKHVYVEEGA